MIRTIMFVSAFLPATSSIVLAEDRESALLNWGSEQQHFQRADMNVSMQEYEETYRRNRRFVGNNLESYSKHALGLIGVPEQGVNLMGAALGMAINGARLNLNKSNTLGLEFRDVGNSDRSLHFGIKLDW